MAHETFKEQERVKGRIERVYKRLVARIGDPHQFRTGREMVAWIGPVP
jgi:hypothetical protein